MYDSFTPPGAFGFGPRGPHERRQAHREMREHLREHFRQHQAGADGPVGGGGFQASFGLGPGRGFGATFDPRSGFGFGFGPGTRGRRGRSRRGDVRTAILVLLSERPMHGYEMIQEIAERSGGLWRPSPGSVYPTLQLLVDEGLLAGREADGSKRLFELTQEGRAAAENIATPPWEQIAEGVPEGHVNLHTAVAQLMGAVAQSAHTATAEQQQRIVDIVNGARREIYHILGEAE